LKKRRRNKREEIHPSTYRRLMREQGWTTSEEGTSSVGEVAWGIVLLSLSLSGILYYLVSSGYTG